MHPHAEVIDRLYRSLAAHKPDEMAECYHEEATFQDIAFRLKGKKRIHDMWSFVTDEKFKLEAEFGLLPMTTPCPDGRQYAWLIDRYRFYASNDSVGKPVTNVIVSSCTFAEDNWIQSHRDLCDPVIWANQAMAGPKLLDALKAWVAGRFRLARTMAARTLLRDFLRKAEGISSESPKTART